MYLLFVPIKKKQYFYRCCVIKDVAMVVFQFVIGAIAAVLLLVYLLSPIIIAPDLFERDADMDAW